jgi:hypothetical protein
VAAKAYPGPAWAEAHRPHFAPSYARHGYVWAYGALAHRTGEVLLDTADRRTTATWVQFLDRLEGWAPAGEVYLIADALPLGPSSLPLRAPPQEGGLAQPDEGFWKILTQRALHGRTCRSPAAVAAALQAGVADWNEHPTPFRWGQPQKPKRKLKRAYVYRI